MTPGEVERAYEDIKRHLGQAQQHKQAGADDLMRAEAEAAAALFQPVLTEAGDLLGMLDVLRAALLSFGYSEEECNTLLSQSRSPGSMKKPRRAGSAKIPAKAPRPEPLPESESINLHDAPDFFQQEGETALREQAQWLDDKLGLDSQFLSKVLHQNEAIIRKWKNKTARLSAASKDILSELWHMVLHLLSHYNNEEQRILQLLEQSITEDPPSLVGPPPTPTMLPLCPPWFGASSLKSYLEEHGVDAINQVNKWLMSLRFGDPYATSSRATTWL